MAWHEFTESLRRRVQHEKLEGTRGELIGRLVGSATTAGVLVAAMVFPAAAVTVVTANNLSHDIQALPLELEDLPNPQTTKLLSASGELIAYFYQENRDDVPLAEIAPVMQDAILAIEDTRFRQHGALDIKGTIRAAFNNATTGTTQGGSTITQQLVKLLTLQQSATDEEAAAAVAQTPARKLRELKLAIAYEKTHSKDEILERYLNTAYFGGGAHGIAAAASHYFSVTPDKLNSLQAATLAGLVKNPSEFDPRQNPDKAVARRNLVLHAMAREGNLTWGKAEALQARDLELKITRYPNGCVTSVASFSCDYIRQYLLDEPALGTTIDERRAALERGGLTIKSNIDIRMQQAANDAVAKSVRPTDRAIGSIALVEPGTGKVRGVAQSRPMGTDEKKGESFLNFSVPPQYGQSSGFQAGSTFKYFTVAAALKEGIKPSQSYNARADMVMPSGSFYDCDGGSTDLWKVSNSTTSGYMNMYKGTRQSVNTYFAQLEKDAKLCNVITMARKMGIKVPHAKDGEGANDEVPSFTLGVTSVSTLEMASAYATAAAGGKFCHPRPVDEIRDFAGKVVKTYKASCEQVLTKDEAATINDILKGLQQPGGFGYSAGTALNVPSAAKTGTTQENRAVWYVGYTPQIAAAAMIAGADEDGKWLPLDGQTINGRYITFQVAAGSTLAGPMWKLAMGVIQQYLDPINFDAPPEPEPAPVRRYYPPKNSGDDDEPGGGDNGGGGNDNPGNKPDDD